MKSLPLLLVLVALSAGPALADLKTETVTRASMVAGMGSTEINSVTQYQGDKRSDDHTMKMVGGVMGALAGKPQSSVEITRLDKGVVWDVNQPQKTYTERPITALTGQEVKGGTKSGPAQKPYKIVKSDIKVTKTGATKTINGFACTEYLITWEVVLEDTASKSQTTQVMTTDLWNTPLTDQLKQARDIENAFGQEYAQKLGLGLSPEESNQLGASMLTSMYGLDSKETADKLEEVGKEMAKVEGYPIVTDVKWQMKGDTTARKTEAQAQPEEPPTSLGGLLANKLAPKPSSNPQDAGVMFSSHHEVKSVSLDAVPATAFGAI